MKKSRFLILYLWILSFSSLSSSGQQLADTLIQWQGYSQSGSVRLQLFVSPEKKERTHVIVLQEQAENRGPAVQNDLEYLVEEIGRLYRLDPANAYWVLHWGAFSFQGAADSRKEIFLRATFRRGKNNRLGAPQWRVIRREEVEEMTDRHFR